ncbi:lipid II flippase MurJ [Aliamphritea hakodatensis]|uniref:lipid II flippase MurJ n=1 Tax=Aliamphritea hakodatensis TaxID=2895352 RepID=UPI0022FD7ACF|nr:lipid II flippase MurJ [Aliamphritea hakodatensis]
MIKKILYSSLALNLGLLLGRFLGFFREAVIADKYGVSLEADILVLILTVPDMLVNILVGGALGVVLIPRFSKNPEMAINLLYQAILMIGGVAIVLTAVFVFFSANILGVLVPGFSSDRIEKASEVLRLVLWLIPLTVLSGVVTAYLHSRNRFAVAALGTFIINFTIILGLVFYADEYGLIGVACFVLIGGLLRLMSQLCLVDIRTLIVSSFSPFLLNNGFFKKYCQALVSGSLLLFLPVIGRAISSFSGDGSVAVFNYSIKLVEFPLAIGVTFLIAVLYPRLAACYKADMAQYKLLVCYGVRAVLGMSLIVLTALVLGVDEYVQFVFGYGGISAEKMTEISYLTAVGLLSLPLQGLSIFFTAVFNSKEKTYLPMYINLIGVCAFVSLNLSGLLGDGLDSIMWGLFCCYLMIVFMQLVVIGVDGFVKLRDVFEIKFLIGLAFCVGVLMFGLSSLLTILSSWGAVIGIAVMTSLAIGLLVILDANARTLILRRLYSK